MNSEKKFKSIVNLYQTLIFRIKELINESNKESFTKLNQQFIQSLFSFILHLHISSLIVRKNSREM